MVEIAAIQTNTHQTAEWRQEQQEKQEEKQSAIGYMLNQQVLDDSQKVSFCRLGMVYMCLVVVKEIQSS